MKNLLLIIPLICISCSTAEIAVNNSALSRVNVIAVAPFISSYSIDPLIYKESEENFASAFTRLNYKVIELNSASQNQAENRLNLQEETIKKMKSEAAASGAQALLYGKIIFHEETTRDVFTHRPLIFRRYSLFDADDEIKTITEFKFQIHISLLSLSDDTVILDVKNRYISAEKDEYMPAFLSLEAYRKYTLEKTAYKLAAEIRKITAQ